MVFPATDLTGTGLGVFKFEDQSSRTTTLGRQPQGAGVYYPTYTVMPPHNALVATMAGLCKYSRCASIVIHVG